MAAGVGVSLFDLVLMCVAEEMEFFSPLLTQLPQKLQAAIHHQHSTLTNRNRFSFIHCSRL